MENTTLSGSASELLRVLADANRWELLRALVPSDRRVGELCAALDRPQNLISYHLGQLRAAGLVTARRSSADGRDTYYAVDLDRCATVLSAAGAALHPGIRLEVTPRRDEPALRRTPRVLFLCTGNSARSQIAQALLERLSDGAVAAASAGSHPKSLHPEAVRVLADRGIDISGRTTTSLERYRRRRFDQVITLCDKVREICPEFPGHPVTAHWSIADPATDDAPDAFERVATVIERRVRLLIASLFEPTTRKDQP